MRKPRLLLAFIAIFLSVTLASAQTVFFGNLHSHTSYSDGSGTPDQAFKHARNAGLDFFAITEHNHAAAESGADDDRRDGILIATNPGLYNSANPASLVRTAERLTEDGKFVALYGQEFSTISKGNHVNVFDIPNVITVPNGQFKQLLTSLESNRDSSGEMPLIQFNHPGLFDNASIEYGRDKFASTEEWVASLDPHVKLIEVLNGPAMTKTSGNRSSEVQEKDFFEYLNLGFHLAPSTGQDNHYRTWGTATDARVAVLAESLTKKDILAALKARHAYATEDKNLRIIFRVNGHLMGDIVTDLPPVGSELDIRLSIKDDDEPDASYRVEVYSDTPGGEPAKLPVNVFQIEGDTPTPVKLEGVRFEKPGQYVLLKIIQTPEHGPHDRAWTAPVWFEPPGARPPSATDPVRIVALVPDPSGRDDEEESITLRNTSSAPISLTGWTVRDLSGQVWTLDRVGSIAGGQEAVVKRNRQPMTLNNDGDSVELRNQNGRVVQTVTYRAVEKDEVVRP